MLPLILLIVRIWQYRAMILPEKLYKEALKNENNGFFQKAQLGYQYAMQELKAKKLRSQKLVNRITDKLKVLQTVIENDRVRNIKFKEA